MNTFSRVSMLNEVLYRITESWGYFENIDAVARFFQYYIFQMICIRNGCLEFFDADVK